MEVKNTSIGLALFVTLACHVVLAQSPEAPRPRMREIFIPFDELKVVLEGQPQRVFMTRGEFMELLAKARRTPETKYPHDAAVLSASYTGVVETGRARIAGSLVIDVLTEGLHALPLDISGVGLLSAQLDDKPAPLGLEEGNRVTLFVEGQGKHRLELELVVPLETTAALQSLKFQLPTPAATRFSLKAPGNVEVRSGADVVERVVEKAGDQTRLELLLRPGGTSLVMTLNNRLLLKRQVVVARSVQISELTTAYERLHASVSLSVLHGAVDRFRLATPAGFEVTEVASPLLAQWVVKEVDGKSVLEARLSEPTNETVVLNISAVRTPAVLANWSWPQLEALDVEAHSAVLGLLLEDRLQAHSLAQEGLLRIDNRVLTDALPASVLEAEPGAPRVRPIVSFFAPQGTFALSAAFTQPPVRLNVTTTALLTMQDKALHMRGSFALLPEREKLFTLDFTAPADWKITSITNAAGQSLSFELYPAVANRIRVRVPLGGVPAGQTHNLFFQATHTPDAWLEDWATIQTAFPVFRVEGATHDAGALAVKAIDDMFVRPETLAGLTPLDEREKAKYSLTDVATDLFYRYDSPDYNAQLAVERKQPRITSRVYNFLRMGQERIVAHYELVYDIADAHTRRLRLSLPSSTPASLSIRGLDGVQVTEFTQAVEGETRHWSVTLGERRQGRVRLAVDFEDRFSIVDRAGRGLPQEFTLPLAKADAVVYQSGVIAVEGAAELDVGILKHPRVIDVGELVDAEYQPGRRLLGAFGYLGDAAEVLVRVARHPGYGLPPTIVERAELVTLVSAHGLMQTAARYDLRTKAQFLEIQLPQGAELWSAYLDGKPGQPQRDGQRILLSLAHASEDVLRNLQLVYETPASQIALWQTVEAAAPKLFLRAAEGTTAAEVPVADLRWHLHIPDGHRLTHAGGTVHTNNLVQRVPPLARVGAVLYMLAGGVQPGRRYSSASVALSVDSKFSEMKSSAATSESAAPDSYYMGSAPQAFDSPRGEAAITADDQATFRAGGKDMYDKLQSPTTRFVVPDLAIEGAAKAPAAPSPAPLPEPTMAAPGRREGVAAALPPVADRGVNGNLAKTPGEGEKAEQSKQPPTPKYWALEGVRSLKIDIQPSGSAITFHSLGEEPRLEATLANRTRLTALAWGVSLLIGLMGLRLTNRPTRIKFRYVAAVLVFSALLPLAGDWFDELAETFDLAFLTGCLLIPYYMAAAALRWTFQRVGSVARLEPVTAAVVLLIAMAVLSSEASAQQPTAKPINEILADLEKLIVPGKPVDVPKDAIVVPYESQPNLVADPAQKLLVPYEQYVELWNRAFPDQKIVTRPLPATHALAGAVYKATLAEGDYLLVHGKLHIDVYGDEMVAVPLALEGGVLARAMVDGQPARLRVPEVADGAADAGPKKPVAAPAKTPAGNLYVLHISGKGRKTLELEIRLKLDRQGGWRVAAGRLPSAPATSLELVAPQAQTEVRLAGALDRRAYETTKAQETIETALASGGRLNLQWRPKVGEAQVDQSLTADSTAVLDVREDGLRLHWNMKLEFRRGQREVFTIRLPKGYLVERVTGANIRGWEVKALDQNPNEQELHITLLKAARDREEFGMVLSRRLAIGQEGAPQKFEAPVVRPADSVLHHGRMLVRRSPQLELRVTEITGLSRTDSPMEETALPLSTIADESPLGIRPLATYQFISTPYTLAIEVQGTPTTARASVQTLLKLAERETRLESRVLLAVEGRPLYRIRALLPEGLKLDEVTAPGDFEHAVTDQGGRQLLTVYLASGQTGQVSLILRGTLERPADATAWSLPNLQVLDVQDLAGQIVVQSDPAFDVRTSNLVGAESLLLDRTFGWLVAEQRPLARVALGYRANEYAGQLVLVARPPHVRSFSITNVRVTNRAIEETILLEFTIREAGIRQVSFLLPESLKDARVSVPLLRQKTVTAVDPAPAGQAGNWNRVTLDLQDEVMNQLRVLVEHDRLLTSAAQTATIPNIETGITDARYVTLESAGRDEVVVDTQQGLDVLSRELSQWHKLASLLGSNLTQAYLVREGVAQPRLVLKTKDRTAVETVGARIGLAETWLMVDAHGAYRGMVQYHVDNSTEQFLDVTLPKDARLWTVRVAGEGVKPTQTAGSSPQTVRIPLIKTAAGDQDYLVTLKYGGRMDSITSMSEVSFPLVKTVNINAELSQVRLYLPDTHHWFDFGGTMSRVGDAGDLTAGFLAYRNRQIERLSEILSSQDPYSRARAANNLKQLKLDDLQYETSRDFFNESAQRQKDANTTALDAAERVIQQQAVEAQQLELDNRVKFNDLYSVQGGTRSKNVVQELGGNFADPNATAPAKPQSGKESFNLQWLKQNSLQPQLDGRQGKQDGTKKAQEAEVGRKAQLGLENGRSVNPGLPQAAGVMKGGEGKPGDHREDFDQSNRQLRDLNRQDESQQQLRRYQQRLEQQNAQQMPAQQPFGQQPGGMGGSRGGTPTNPPPGANAPVGQPSDAILSKESGWMADGDPARQLGEAPKQTTATAPVSMASLDIELPSTEGFREVLFKMPRGDIEISARPLATRISQRLVRIGWVTAVLLGAGLIYAAVRRFGTMILASRSSAALMLALGVLSMITCVLPFAGLLLAIAGATLLLGSLVNRRAALHGVA